MAEKPQPQPADIESRARPSPEKRPKKKGIRIRIPKRQKAEIEDSAIDLPVQAYVEKRDRKYYRPLEIPNKSTRKEDEEIRRIINRESKLLLGALLITMALIRGHKRDVNPYKIKQLKDQAQLELTQTKEDFFANKDYHRFVADGLLTEEQKKKRTILLDPKDFAEPRPKEAVPLIIDFGGVAFYKANKGDTISGIRDLLSRHPDYAYLKTQKRSLEGFNYAKPSELKAGEEVQVPLDIKERQLTDAQFAISAKQAIQEMLAHPEFGPGTKKIVDKIGEQEFIASLLAIAKQEAGGKPIGQFSYYRVEPERKTARGEVVRRKSVGPMHVVVERPGVTPGPGKKAAKILGITDGQATNPVEGIKLSIGWHIKKTKNPEKYFPIDQNILAYAKFYNGRDVETKNPNYIPNLSKYLRQSRELLTQSELLAEVELESNNTKNKKSS